MSDFSKQDFAPMPQPKVQKKVWLPPAMTTKEMAQVTEAAGLGGGAEGGYS